MLCKCVFFLHRPRVENQNAYTEKLMSCNAGKMFVALQSSQRFAKTAHSARQGVTEAQTQISERTRRCRRKRRSDERKRGERGEKGGERGGGWVKGSAWCVVSVANRKRVASVAIA